MDWGSVDSVGLQDRVKTSGVCEMRLGLVRNTEGCVCLSLVSVPQK